MSAAACLRRSIGLLAALCALAAAPARADLEVGPALATIDLTTAEGVARVRGEWRYSDVRVLSTEFRAAGPEGQPTGPPVATWDIEPKAGWREFDDSGWEVVAPESLDRRRAGGRLCFNWYRIRITVPESVGGASTAGSMIVFETSVDDYAEIWVDGELPRLAGQSGGSVVAGWNADNRVVLTRSARPGQEIQLAVFGMNGPISGPPTNFIWMRKALLGFHPGGAAPVAVPPQEVNVEVVRLHPALDAIVPPNPKVYKLAEGFEFIEGPLWTPAGDLVFSDPNANRIYRYSDEAGLSVLRERSGYSGADVGEYGQPGSNGLTLDSEGRLTIAEHGNHRISRLEADGGLTVLADAYGGLRLNSPNDLVYRSDGSLYFSDPPFGLPRFFDDPRKELDYSGIFRWADGRLELLSAELSGPNGLAFSPDERYLYVGNWDPERKVVMRYEVLANGALAPGEVFFDMSAAPEPEALDGLKVDRQGNLYVSGPGGLWILSPQGTHLGTIRLPRLPANFAWGGPDGKILYLAARSALYRMPLLVEGIRPRPTLTAAR